MSAINDITHRREQLLSAIAEIVGFPVDALQAPARLVEDLGFDSLELAELVLLVLEMVDDPPLSRELEDFRWEGVTVGQVLTRCGLL
jgi:acyl carrier protein